MQFGVLHNKIAVRTVAHWFGQLWVNDVLDTPKRHTHLKMFLDSQAIGIKHPMLVPAPLWSPQMLPFGTGCYQSLLGA